MPPTSRVPAACLVACVFSLAGCSDPHAGRVAVSGAVKHKGQALKDGIVLFEALDGQDTGGSAQIGDGRYSIPREGGLKPGKYLVRVTAGDGATPVNPVNPDEPPGPGGGANIVSKELIPKEWNAQSKQQVTVTQDSPNTFDFDIP